MENKYLVVKMFRSFRDENSRKMTITDPVSAIFVPASQYQLTADAMM
jgi:hypothetical protein